MSNKYIKPWKSLHVILKFLLRMTYLSEVFKQLRYNNVKVAGSGLVRLKRKKSSVAFEGHESVHDGTANFENVYNETYLRNNFKSSKFFFNQFLTFYLQHCTFVSPCLICLVAIKTT